MTCSIRSSWTIALEVPAGSEDGEAGYVASVKGLLVEEPDRSQAQLGMLAESLRNQSPDVPRANDQHALTGVTLSPGAALGGDEPDSARDHERGR